MRREPEARQLERFARLGSTVFVAAGIRVKDDGRVQVVLQLCIGPQARFLEGTRLLEAPGTLTRAGGFRSCTF
jgi:hypothetical protein